MKSVFKYFLFAFLLIVIDQVIKLWVHNNMLPGYMGEIKVIGDLFKLHYVTNRGMAFGLELPFANGKVVLSLFRLVAMIFIGLYLNYLYKQDFHKGLLYSVAAILGGAIGNLIDSIFYGVALGNAPFDAPSPWFNGQVIDMFFFDIYEGTIPEWIPYFGGTWYSTPIFNFADACIFCGVVTIMIFQNKFFSKPDHVLIGGDLDNDESQTAETSTLASEVVDNQLNNSSEEDVQSQIEIQESVIEVADNQLDVKLEEALNPESEQAIETVESPKNIDNVKEN